MSSTAKIQVTDSIFDCDNCSNTIERILQKKPGIEEVRTNEANRHLEVEYNSSQIRAKTIRQIVEQWGYNPG
jgi:copper chaperone CopZ